MPNQPIVTAGLVLRETVTRETDKILTVLTPDRGKISLIARGARRKNSRLAAACQLLAYSELTIYEKGQWFMLDEAETLELFTGLRTDFVALSLASYLADLTDATAQGEDTSQLLRLLLNALYALSVLHKPPQLVKPAFELRLMALSGFEPLADGCAVCGRPEPEDPVLDAVHGVVCCAACREKGGLAMPLSPAALAALRHVLYCPDKKLYSFTLDTPALRQLSAECAGQMENILWDYDILVQLDVIFARAQLSYQLNASRPEVRRRGGITLRRARHPLLDQAKAVPITVELGEQFDTLVITGPNTGGKTVTLKTIGLLCLMAQCGLHIPADSGSAVRVFHRVLADVGDEQSIEQSLSTFSAHMSNIVQILREVDDKSLLLFDELGAGTDPVEGAALAIAIIESARSQGALIAATTHYAELKTFAMTTAGVENASCEFDVQTLRPTYRLLIGIPGKSNAFAISRRLGLDESVIQAAQAQMDSDSVRFEDVLTQLEEKRQRLEKAQAEADRLWRQREEDARKARTFREQMEKAKENARTKGEAEAKRIVRQAQAQADEIFAQLDQLRRQQQKQLSFQELNDAKAAVRHSLNQAQDALHIHDQPQEPVYTPSRPIEVGDLVELPGVKMAASVLAVNNDGTLLLQAGKMKMTVKAQQVRLPEGQPKKKPAAPASGGSAKLNLQSRAASELDIRGYETLEAESVVENYIDSAVMAKLGTVTIIHGKGTGALRKAVHEMLKRNKAVKSFRLGRYGEGEAGVTVVELK